MEEDSTPLEWLWEGSDRIIFSAIEEGAWGMSMHAYSALSDMRWRRRGASQPELQRDISSNPGLYARGFRCRDSRATWQSWGAL